MHMDADARSAPPPTPPLSSQKKRKLLSGTLPRTENQEDPVARAGMTQIGSAATSRSSPAYSGENERAGAQFRVVSAVSISP
jgi:hypothetical protein